jgi:hypothetical protein
MHLNAHNAGTHLTENTTCFHYKDQPIFFLFQKLIAICCKNQAKKKYKMQPQAKCCQCYSSRYTHLPLSCKWLKEKDFFPQS